MGHLQASEMSRFLGASYTALHWHLTCNHYPPLPQELVQTAQQAVEAANAGEWDKELHLPPGIALRGQQTATAALLVETMHLEAFLEPEDGEEVPE